MWTPCPVGLNNTSKILGLELSDCLAVTLTPVLVSGWVDTLESFGCGALVGVALYFLKRGKPPGALLHTLHSVECGKLPGVLGPVSYTYSPG
jgi:hypothetical protein